LICLAVFTAASLAGDSGDGLLAVVLLSTTPYVMTCSRVYDIHLVRMAAISLVLMGLYCFHKAPSARTLILLVFTALLGQYLCPLGTPYRFFILAVFAPAVWVVARGICRKEKIGQYILTGLLLAVIFLFPLGKIFGYSFHEWPMFKFQLLQFLFYEPVPTILPTISDDPRALLASVYALWQVTLSWPLNILYLVGFAAFVWRGSGDRVFWLLAVVLPLVIITVLYKRNIYYIANILPALSVAVALGLGALCRRLPSPMRIILILLVFGLHLGYVFHAVTPGSLSPNWQNLFVAGRTQYTPGYEQYALEAIGSPAGLEDSKADFHSRDLFRQSPRPLAIGIIGKICIQTQLPRELRWFGIFSRELFCATDLIPPPVSAPPTRKFNISLTSESETSSLDLDYDAVVVLPVFREPAEINTAESILEIYDLLVAACERKTLVYEGFQVDLAETINLPALKIVRSRVADLSSRYSRKLVKGNYIIFIEPENAALGRQYESEN